MTDEQIHEMIELELAILIRRVTSISGDKKLAHLDRSAELLMHHIYKNGPAGVKALAEVFHLDISTVSRQAASLEQKEYIYRIPDPQDGRAYTFELTETGRSELISYKAARAGRVEAILREWPEEEQEQFGNLLKKFNQSAYALS